MTDKATEPLEAGGYLHPDTDDPGEGVPVTARVYRRPGLADRTIVRLVPEETGEAEDAAAAYLGMERVGEAEVVAYGARERLAFPEWVLVHHPEDGHHALALLPEMDRLSRLARAKAKVALEGFTALGARMASSVPHLLPTFFERAAREFLAAEKPDFAARMFAAARKAESEHGLPVDQDRVDDVFLEFALAGALPARTLSEFSKELALRLPADEALARFVRLATRRASGGLPPSSPMAADLRRLAKAASGDGAAIERDYLAQMLTYPATGLASEAWWKAHLPALVALAKERPETRRVLLGLVPHEPDLGFLEFWLDLLVRTGAADLLRDGCAEPGPEDGVVGWLERLLAARGTGHWAVRRVAALEDLLTTMSGGLKAELAERGVPLAVPLSADLLDLLLDLGVPVADPGPRWRISLSGWAAGQDRRDLAALSADPRFGPALRGGMADLLIGGRAGHEVVASAEALRSHIQDHVRHIASDVAAAGLPQLRAAVGELDRLPAEFKLTAEDEVRAALATDVVDLLARTLRGGVFDELSWPAYEDALNELYPSGQRGAATVAEEWPYLVVASGQRALVIDGSGVVLDHDLRVPRPVHQLGFRYVDGALLVQWRTESGGPISGYWHTRPDHVLRLEGDWLNGTPLTERATWQRISLEVSGGGRVTGAGAIHRGDALAPRSAETASDGRAYWVRRYVDKRFVWHALDPRTGEPGQPDMPAFFAEPGAAFRSGFLAPFPGTGTTPVGAVVNGLLGQRTVTLPDGTERGEDLAGNATPAVNGHGSLWPLFLPGDPAPRALARAVSVSRTSYRLIGPDGLLLADTAMSALFRAGSQALPVPHYWAYARPRDPRGSAALRRVDRALAAGLIDGVTTVEDVVRRVTAALPEITHEGLHAGVVGVVRAAVAGRDLLAEARERLAASRKREPVVAAAADPPDSPKDDAVFRAVDGLLDNTRVHWGSSQSLGTTSLLWHLAWLRAGAPTPDGPVRQVELHQQFLDLSTAVEAHAALVLRAASGITPEPMRTALHELLGLLDRAGLAEPEPDAWRYLRLRLHDRPDRATNHCRGIVLEGGAFLAIVAQGGIYYQRPIELTALYYDPSGRFVVPAPYEVAEERPLAAESCGVPVSGALALLEANGPVPWNPAHVEEFARLTGATPTTSALVVSGLLDLSDGRRSELPEEVRKTLRVKIAEVRAAQEQLRRLPGKARRELVGALLPADPARLWTDGLDVAKAAEVWNRAVPRRAAVPEALIAEAVKESAVHNVQERLRGLLDAADYPPLSLDSEFRPGTQSFEPFEFEAFTASVLNSVVPLIAWTAHRLPVGDPLRARLPAALEAVRARLANPGLVLSAPGSVWRDEFREAAGTPQEEGDGWERYGAVLLLTGSSFNRPGVKVALLDENGDEPHLALLRDALGLPLALEVALRVARDPRFAALLTDPGDPVEGERLKDGTWYPQDPSRSVPDLVREVAKAHGLSEDAAAVYLMLLAMPDPTDRNTARWTGWKPARIKAARAELAATELVTEARRTKAGRTLFLPGPWTAGRGPKVPMESWKHPLYPLSDDGTAPLTTVVPTEPVADLYRRAWRRIAEGDVPRYGDLELPRQPRRRR
ncbi:DNA-binding protein [Actinocorallia sp. A-T 12471]|uniref:DNA-binding protein n=1 Tax=Actinocorallia sp. A-T 12471 TaxID=3089813 RepID=UPI0029D2633E|nr:DNA-binding protein [Actinocorallia sp. A-T 12471]MDX6742783.1 DNA-binding protein [Actinocorallia sp. A-T 12471]